MELSDHYSSFSVSVSRVHAVTVYYPYNPTDLDFCRKAPMLSRRDGIPVKKGVIFFTITSRPTKGSTHLPIQWVLRVLLPGRWSSCPGTAINNSFRITAMFHTHTFMARFLDKMKLHITYWSCFRSHRHLKVRSSVTSGYMKSVFIFWEIKGEKWVNPAWNCWRK